MRIWRLVGLGCVLALGWSTASLARQFTERELTCRGLSLLRGDDGKLHLFAHCRTELRGFDLDVLPLLTGLQRAQLVNIYATVQDLVATNETIPTPTPTSTP